jgi:CheY-like chemotaxis protein
MDNVKIPAPFSRNRKLSDFIKIEIKDYGTGISERIIPYIFDPYYTTKGFGTGLGLSVSHSIVRSHGGDITVKSKPGEGTSFFIFLPATMRKKVPEIRSEIQFKQLTGRILLMDDDPHLRPMLKKMLEHIGLTAECVPDGDTAIEKFNKAKNSNEPFNAVIMDLTISGGMGGVQTSAKIRELDETVPLIVASGYCDDPVMSDYKAYGFSERLVKPFTLDDLRKAMSAVLKN